MAIKIEPVGEKKTFAPDIPEGLTSARFIGYATLGTQPKTFANETKHRPMIKLMFEASECCKQYKEGEPEKPAFISKKVSLSTGEKAKLRHFVDAITGGYSMIKSDLDAFLGKALMIEVKHFTGSEGNLVPYVEGFKPVPRVSGTDLKDYADESKFRFPVPPLVNDTWFYELEEHPHNWDKLNERTQKEVLSSPEGKKLEGHPVDYDQVEEVDEIQI
jgi:hypothetical protein